MLMLCDISHDVNFVQRSGKTLLRARMCTMQNESSLQTVELDCSSFVTKMEKMWNIYC